MVLPPLSTSCIAWPTTWTFYKTHFFFDHFYLGTQVAHINIVQFFFSATFHQIINYILANFSFLIWRELDRLLGGFSIGVNRFSWRTRFFAHTIHSIWIEDFLRRSFCLSSPSLVTKALTTKHSSFVFVYNLSFSSLAFIASKCSSLSTCWAAGLSRNSSQVNLVRNWSHLSCSQVLTVT